MYLPCVKNIFKCVSEVFLSFDSKTIRFFRFADTRLREIKYHSLKEKTLIIYFVTEILGKCMPTVKKYFQLNKLRSSFIRSQNTWTNFLLMSRRETFKIAV